MRPLIVVVTAAASAAIGFLACYWSTGLVTHVLVCG